MIINLQYKIYNYCIIVLILLILIILVYRLVTYQNIDSFTELSSSNSKIKIIPDIIGGIGNQLFIIAAGYAFAKKYNLDLTLDYRKKIFSYGADRNNYYNTIFTKIPVNSNITKSILNNSSITYKLNESEYSSNTIDNSTEKWKNKKYIYLTGGYYQEYSYFNDLYNEILKLFKEPANITNKINMFLTQNNLQNTNNKLVAIHFRMEDKFTPSDHKGLYNDNEYDYIINDLQNFEPDTKFLIFSNDMANAKNKINSRNHGIDPSRIIYVSLPDYVELYLLTRCNEYIASPSTFNWWGIYLNPSPNKKIHIYWKPDCNYRRDFLKKYKVFPNINIKYYNQ
jgi:hypothetical protein